MIDESRHRLHKEAYALETAIAQQNAEYEARAEEVKHDYKIGEIEKANAMTPAQ